MGHVREQRPERQQQIDAQLRGRLHDLRAEAAPPQRRLDAGQQQEVTSSRCPSDLQDGLGPLDVTGETFAEADLGPGDREVVVLLGVDRRHGAGIEGAAEEADGRRGRFPGVGPAFEGGEEDGAYEIRAVLPPQR